MVIFIRQHKILLELFHNLKSLSLKDIFMFECNLGNFSFKVRVSLVLLKINRLDFSLVFAVLSLEQMSLFVNQKCGCNMFLTKFICAVVDQDQQKF